MRKRVQLPHISLDREYLRGDRDRGIHQARPIDIHTTIDDGSFQDGPVCKRVAVVDFDVETGKLRPGVRFVRRGIGRTVSCYAAGHDLEPESKIGDFETDGFLQLSPFSTVVKLLDYFEGADILGRRIAWSFPSEQLLIVPRAGQGLQAFYERETGSLQFFYERIEKDYTNYSALSHHIVTHELTHALVDTIVPDLYDACTPESLALHEALADMSAILQTASNVMLVFSLAAITGGGKDPADVLSRLAGEFGTDLRRHDGANALRWMKNTRTLDPNDDSTDNYGTPNRVDVTDPHALSQVLTGALYNVLQRRIGIEELLDEWDIDNPRICRAAVRISKVMFRALDYLPPGNASFADYGRAFCAAAMTSTRRERNEPNWLAEQLRTRHVIAASDDLAIRTTRDTVDVDLEDPRTARKYAERNRRLLQIPDGVCFDVLPAAVAARGELMLRVRWRDSEKHDVGKGFPTRYEVTRGTTLVVDVKSRRILSILTTDPGKRQREGRAALLRRWARDGRLKRDLTVSTHGKVTRIEGGGRMLHIAEDV